MAASLPTQMLPPRPLPAGPSNHRRSRSRELWASLGGIVGAKSMCRDEQEDELMPTGDPTSGHPSEQ